MDKTDQEIRRSLIAEIEDAFGDVRRGNGISLHQTRVIDDFGPQPSEPEQAEARKNDTDTRWQDVPDAWIEKFYNALCFLDPEGFRYYLPAFMVWTLRRYDTNDSLAGASTIYCLDPSEYDPTIPPDDPQPPRRIGVDGASIARYETFSLAQASAIAHFLQYFASLGEDRDGDAAETAIDQYWRRFL